MEPWHRATGDARKQRCRQLTSSRRYRRKRARRRSTQLHRTGVTTHEALKLLGMTFRTDATIDRVETGRLLQWRARDRQKQLRGSRLVEPTGSASSRFTEMVEGHLLGPLRALEPLVAWLLQRQATADLRLQAAQMAAGHDEVRGDDPGQKGENSGPVV